MSELDDIKARAAERRKYHPGKTFGFPAHGEAEADLDRAIAIADWWKERAEYLEESLTEELDEARAEVETLKQVISTQADQFNLATFANKKELGEAHAAVLKLRDELRRAGDVLQTAYSAGNELGRCGVSLSVDWPKIQDQSYEEVGEFLYPDITKGGVEFYDRLAETEHYEAFRQA